MRNRGFTLVELMVTVAIVAILAAIAFPSFQDSMRRNRLATATNELLASLSLARSEALRNPGGAVVCTSTAGVDCDGSSWNDGWMVWVDVNGDGNPGGVDDRVLRYVQGLRKVDVSAESSGGTADENIIRFDRRGRVTGEAVDIFLQPEDCSPEQDLRREIAVSVIGQTKTTKSACI